MGNFIEVEELIANKSKNGLKWLPKFFINWIKKIVHQDEVNDLMHRYEGVDAQTFCAGIVKEFNLKLNVKGIENMPSLDQKCIITSNHPLGGLDAISVVHAFREVRPDLKFIVNDIMMHFTTLKDIFIGVNKVGKSFGDSLRKVEEEFEHGSATYVFPAGLVSRKVKGKIVDTEWMKTVIVKSKKYNKPIVPVYIEGRLTNRFYNISRIRSFFGIKLNVEMFFLVDELFKQKNITIDIIIGKPISPDTFAKSKKPKEWAKWLKDVVYQLREA